MPYRICLVRTCPNPATTRGRCPLHAREHERSINRAGHHIYRTKRWQVVRSSFLFNHPLCQCDNPDCTEISTDVDHIIPLAQGGDPWAANNLRSLAHSCHSKLTRAAQGARS